MQCKRFIKNEFTKMFEKSIEILTTFRKSLHELIPSYRDATLDLMDALSTNKNAQSVTQLSDNQFFRRKYSSLTKVIHYFLVSKDEENRKDDQEKSTQSCSASVDTDYRPNKLIQKAVQKQIANVCSAPEQRNFFYSPVM